MSLLVTHRRVHAKRQGWNDTSIDMKQSIETCMMQLELNHLQGVKLQFVFHRYKQILFTVNAKKKDSCFHSLFQNSQDNVFHHGIV